MKARLLLLTVLLASLPASLAMADPYAQYRGTKLVVSWPALSHFQSAGELVEEFVEKTGIQVEIDAMQYLKLRDRQILEMSRPEGDYDVVAWVVMWKGEYVSKGLLTPLSQFFTDSSLVDPTYDIDDIADAYLQSGGVAGGRKGYLPGKSGALYGLPFGAETSILAYRRDIFEERDIEPPATYAELRAVIQKLAAAGIPALTSRGISGHQVTAAWLLHLAPLGGRVFDDHWLPVLNNEAGVEAARVLREIVRTGPRGIPSFDFGAAAAAFLGGEAAMYLDTLKIAALVRNPAMSKVNGKVAYAPHPTDLRCRSETGGFALGIPANSRNQNAAFLLIQYLTSRAGDRRMVELGGDPVRLSTYDRYQDIYPEYAVILRQLDCADPDWRPLIPEWNELNTDVLGQALTDVILTDKPIQPIMDAAARQAQKIMAREGYYQWSEDDRPEQ